MARIDKLREEAIELRTNMFFILGILMALFGGLGSLYMKLIDSNSILIKIGVIIILILIPILAIIYFRAKEAYHKKLDELGKE